MIDRLADRILRIETGHPVRVCVDGPSAAGKTTLANRLAELLRDRTGRSVIRAELDYFMKMVEDPDAYPYDSPESYYLDAWDYPAIRARLLEPLGPGGNRRHVTALGAPVRIAPDDAILLADGVFVQRPELDAHWDLRIYLHIEMAESLRRSVARDQHWMGGAAEAERRYRTMYLPGELRYQAEVRPRDRAQIVVDAGRPGYG
ncbi:MAG TPA: uridylate kinase [Actinoplanes sp.]|nr:uridylate kinase [Actinoplanes sp.]